MDIGCKTPPPPINGGVPEGTGFNIVALPGVGPILVREEEDWGRRGIVEEVWPLIPVEGVGWSTLVEEEGEGDRIPEDNESKEPMNNNINKK